MECTVSTGQGADRTTRSATLPINRWCKTPRPCVPITTRSMGCVRRVLQDVGRRRVRGADRGHDAERGAVVRGDRRIHLAPRDGLETLLDLLNGGDRHFRAAGEQYVLDGVEQVQPGAELPRKLAAIFQSLHRGRAEVGRHENVLDGNHGAPLSSRRSGKGDASGSTANGPGN